ncbi:MAG: DUF2284 domain-containing protein [Bacillota bacterium]
MRLPFSSHDPQDTGPQYLEDLATGYWFSEVLFTAVELGVFNLLEPMGKTADHVAEMLNSDPRGVRRFLHALWALGLLGREGAVYFNTRISKEYLVIGRENYQGNAILWRKHLSPYWRGLKKCLRAGGRVVYRSDEDRELNYRVRRYVRAMDSVARIKVGEILPIFEGVFPEGEILDVGAGSGAITAGFLGRFPTMRATLMDLPEVLNYAGELMRKRRLEKRVTYCRANILESWPLDKNSFDLVILSNIIHAYSETDVSGVLDSAAECLKEKGFLIIHDFFLEHVSEKASLFDLNMFINTYNGMVFSEGWVREKLGRLKLYAAGLIPLKTDTALIIASKDEKSLSKLRLSPESRLAAVIRGLGFRTVCPIPVGTVHVPGWAGLCCRFGCELYGKPHCPPDSPSPERTREILGDYSRAFLLEGEPPTGDFQRRVLRAEREAFREGFYKAFAFWAGPCALCDSCGTDGVCRNTLDSRPSMEGAGIDVFETVRRAGLSLRPLKDRDDYVKYFALLLLE